MNATIDVLNKAIVSAYGACFLHVASRVREALLSFEWASPPAVVSLSDEQAVFDSISCQMFWLCSVSNDASYFQQHVQKSLESSAADMKAVQNKVESEILKHGKDHVSSNAERQLELSNSVDIVLRESMGAFGDIKNITADYFSCIIFKSFIDHMMKLSEYWKLSITSSASMGEFAGENAKSPLRDILNSIELDFESYKRSVDADCYFELVRICAEKFVLRYFGLLRYLVIEQVVFTTADVRRFTEEVKCISECLCSSLCDDQGTDSARLMTSIVGKFTLLLDAVSLIEYDAESDDFVEELLRLKNFAHDNNKLAVSLSSLLKTIISLKPNCEKLFDSDVSVIPSILMQIESYYNLEVDNTKRGKTDDQLNSDEIEDLQGVAEAVASAAAKKHVRPDPLELMFGKDSIGPVGGKSTAGRKHSILGHWGNNGSGCSNVELDSRLRGDLLTCSRFYKSDPISHVRKENSSAHQRPSKNKGVDTSQIPSLGDKTSSLFSAMFSSQPSGTKTMKGSSSVKNTSLLSKISSHSPPTPYIHITDIIAQNLFSTDTLFSSIPNAFVEVTIAGASVVTEVVNNKLNPNWSDPWMKIAIKNEFSGNLEMNLSVFYKKRLGRPEFIGSVSILLAKFEACESIDELYDVDISKSSEHVVSCFVKSTASGIPAPTLRVMATIIRD